MDHLDSDTTARRFPSESHLAELGHARERFLWILAGSILLFLVGGMSWMSRFFLYDGERSATSYMGFVALFIAAGVVYLLILARIRRAPSNRSLLAWVIGIGFVLRAVFFFSTPIMETDFYRYLWDGAVLASGMNPYEFAPAEVLQSGGSINVHPIRTLGIESGEVLGRINHPELATCYPPAAIGIFALSHAVAPWSLAGWRAVLMAFDTATLLLLLAVLRRIGRSPFYIAVYWWCPLVIKEGFNSAHMDITILPFVIAALCLGFRPVRSWHSFASSGLLGIAVGIKLWPLLLMPLIFRPILKFPRTLVFAALIFSTIVAAETMVLFPSLRTTSDSGLLAYGERWEVNDALFMAILWAIGRLPDIVAGPELLARLAVAGILAVIVIGVSWRKYAMQADQWRAALCIVAAAFLLSPAQFPWYYLWVIPFFAVTPSPALLLLSVLLPLYYLRFYFQFRDNVLIFDHGIVWLEYAPVWALLIFGWLNEYRRKHNHGASIPCDTAVASR